MRVRLGDRGNRKTRGEVEVRRVEPTARGRRGLLVVLSALVSVSALVTGCSYWQVPVESRMAAQSLPARDAADLTPEDLLFYSYTPEPMADLVERRLHRERGSYRIWDLQLPSIGDNGQPGTRVRARYYASTIPGPKRLVLVLPIYGKSTYPSHKVARYLTQERDAETTNVLLFLGGENLYDWRAIADAVSERQLLAEVERAVERIRVTVIDVRRMLDWAEDQPQVDRSRVGIVGFSFSSILANLTMALDPRIDAGVFFMGGGHIHKIFAHCEGNDIQAARRELGPRLGWTDLHFEYHLESPMRPINPVRLASLLEDRPVLLADSVVDGVIPEESRRDLRRALGEPERIRFVIGHRAAFLSLTPLGFNYSTKKIRRFFIENL